MAPEINSSMPQAKNDRRPIYNDEAERGMLGSILLDAGRVLDFCREKQIRPESFYIRPHQVIYAEMCEMDRAHRPIDILTLADRLKTAGRLEEIGGVDFLNRLLDSTPTAAHAEYYVDLVRQQHLLRRIIDCSRNAENECYTSTEHADLVLAKVEQDFFDISEERHDAMKPWPQAVAETMGTIEHILQSKKGLSGIATGFKDLDEKLLGLHKGEMIVLASRPSMGKTSLAMNIVENVAMSRTDNEPRAVGIFSLEMAREQLVMRMLGAHARIPMHTIAGGYLTNVNFGQLAQAADRLMKAPIFLDDSGGLDIVELRARARRMKKKHDIALLVVDYLQLLQSPDVRRQGRQVEISLISNAIKSMAKELRVPVLVLSQLNRAPEAREGKPRLADLRESGSIEQDADVVLLLYSEAKYAKESGEKVADENLIKVIIAKQRNGPIGDVNLIFQEDIMRFENAATGSFYNEAGSPPG